ncbi:MAG: glycine betaine ABC transporter substrate-binding protein, partial [Bacillota bacterium]
MRTVYLSGKGSKLLLLICLLAVLFFISACTEEVTVAEEPESEVKETVRIAYVDWVSEIASAHVVKVVLEEKMGYNCELLSVTAVSMWESVAAGDQDAMVAAWLPTLHEQYYESVKDDVVHLGPNLERVEMGLVVPSYVPVNSIAELSKYAEEFDSKIIGIDPEAGLMGSTEEAMEIYALDQQFELISGSDLTMTSALEIAHREDRW